LLSTATMLNNVRFLMGALSLIEMNMCCIAMPRNEHKNYVIFVLLIHFIYHFYIIFRSSKSGPC
jgi:hypothetical protein